MHFFNNYSKSVILNIKLFSNNSILAILYLGDFSGVFGILSYFYLQKKVSSFYASTVFLIFTLISYILEIYFYKKTFFFYLSLVSKAHSGVSNTS